jgi:murein DD-endopeptidase MepM/ murein hydrolase activator NlpD
MTNFLRFICFIVLPSNVVLAQGTMPIAADSTGNSDSLIAINPGNAFASTFNESSPVTPHSVYDIYWITNSLKCGWKTTDTSMIGMGLESCDTLHPFTMPVVGKLWRGCTSYHAGWDIGLDYGAPVIAGLNGKVRFAKYCSGYGNLVIVRHYSGLEMYYAHLSKIKVKTDQYVEAGDTIGLGGATGRARGTHLHMEFRLCDRALDIADYLVQNDTVVNLYKIIETAAEQNKPQAAQYYTIVKGDNLSSIARRYGTTVTNLCTLNHISRTSTLRIGQRLRVR